MRAYLCLGSNLGDRIANLTGALERLQAGGAHVTARSHVYDTEPVGGPVQPDFYNQVVAVDTDRSPRELLALCHEVEAAGGRDRAGEERNGPRPIDVDILVIEERTVDEPDLVVPHPRLHERKFALVPLAEIAPDLVVPGRGTVRELLSSVQDRHYVRRTA